MIGIIICDDDRFMLELSCKLTEKCIKQHDLSAKIVCKSTNYSDIIHFLKNNKNTYLYFLDLDFGSLAPNGIDIAKNIKEIEPLSKIVFVTSHDNLGINILKSGVEAFGFIEKTPDTKKMMTDYKKYITLVQELNITKSSDKKNSRKIVLPVGIDESITFPVSQILYVESVKTISHFICYHTIDGSKISVRDTIENALSKLGDDFMKSHRSIIINKKHVIAVNDGLVKFSNGLQTVCSFRLKNIVTEKCLK